MMENDMDDPTLPPAAAGAGSAPAQDSHRHSPALHTEEQMAYRRARRAVPRRAKWLAVIMMTIACIHALFVVALPWNLAPLAICVPAGIWLWRLPDAA